MSQVLQTTRCSSLNYSNRHPGFNRKLEPCLLCDGVNKELNMLPNEPLDDAPTVFQVKRIDLK